MPLVNIMLGEVIFGGVGAGLYGILVFVILAVFIAGLMVGRTPEYLGKKIEAFEVQMAMLDGADLPAGDPGVHGDLVGLAGLRHVEHRQSRARTACREILYAYTSAAGNNGSAFGGLSANTHWYNVTLGVDDAGRPLLHDHPAAGDRRQPGPQEARCRRRPARSR